MPSSNTISLNGRPYLAELIPEMVSLAEELASDARLKAAAPLPVDTDLLESAQKEVQTQVCSSCLCSNFIDQRLFNRSLLS